MKHDAKPSDRSSKAAADDRAGKIRRERQAIAYLDALDANDLDAISRLWEQAAEDAELEALLKEMSEGVLADAGHAAPTATAPSFEEDAAHVAGLLHRHMPSAFAAAAAGPPTIADVAAKIAGDPALTARLDPADRAANGRLLAERGELPAELGAPQLARWTATLPVSASANYWRIFRQSAILVAMRHAHQAQSGNLAAARAAGRTPPASKGPGEGKPAGGASPRPPAAGKRGGVKKPKPGNEATSS